MTAKKKPSRPSRARTPKKKIGRPPFVPTERDRANVMAAAMWGATRDDICSTITDQRTGKPISDVTLDKYFEDELKHGRAKMHATIANRIFRMAMEETGETGKKFSTRTALTAAIFIAKTQMGWKERTVAEVEVVRGVMAKPPEMTTEEWLGIIHERNAMKDAPASRGDDGDVGGNGNGSPNGRNGH